MNIYIIHHSIMCIYWNTNIKVSDASCCVSNVDDASQSAQLLAATTLRNCLGTRNLGEILSEKESIAGEMKEVLDVSTKPWGVTVERVEVMDVKIPNTLQRAMAAEAEAARNARAQAEWITRGQRFRWRIMML